MSLAVRPAPHIRNAASNKSMMSDMILTLLALYLIAVFNYGVRAILLGVWSVIVCSAADILCRLAARRPVALNDLSPVVTGLIIPMLLPASVSYSIVAITGLFAIVVAKQFFGGMGHNIFNPAAAGLAFASVCWPDTVFSYPAAFTMLEPFGEVTAKVFSGATYILSVGGVPASDYTSVLLGMLNGPMGTTSVLVVAACMLYLVLRGTVRLPIPLCTMAGAALVVLLFPRAGISLLDSVFFELFATPMFFVSVFLLSDPVTAPKRMEAQICYGFAAGVLIMALERVSAYHCPFAFAVLCMNALTPAVGAVTEHLFTKERRREYEDLR